MALTGRSIIMIKYTMKDVHDFLQRYPGGVPDQKSPILCLEIRDGILGKVYEQFFKEREVLLYMNGRFDRLKHTTDANEQLSDFRTVLEYVRDMGQVFQVPLEEVPRYVNSFQMAAKWRLMRGV
jgi:hypothetical protein